MIIIPDVRYIENELTENFFRCIVADLYTLVNEAVVKVFKKNKDFYLKLYFARGTLYVKVEMDASIYDLAVLIRGHCRLNIFKTLKNKYNVTTEFSNGCEINEKEIITLTDVDLSNEIGYENVEIIWYVKL